MRLIAPYSQVSNVAAGNETNLLVEIAELIKTGYKIREGHRVGHGTMSPSLTVLWPPCAPKQVNAGRYSNLHAGVRVFYTLSVRGPAEDGCVAEKPEGKLVSHAGQQTWAWWVLITAMKHQHAQYFTQYSTKPLNPLQISLLNLKIGPKTKTLQPH